MQPLAQQVIDQQKYQHPHINVTYLSCNKGQFHQGQQINIVCLDSRCLNNPLCCCSCIEQSHIGHRSKTLKKVLAQADEIIYNNSTKKVAQENVSQSQDDVPKSNNKLQSLWQNVNKHETAVMKTFHQLKSSIEMTLNQMEKNFVNYFAQLKKNIQTHEQSRQKPLEVLTKNYQIAKTTALNDQLHTSIKSIMKVCSNIDGSGLLIENKQTTSALISFVNYSLEETSSLIAQKLAIIQKQIRKTSDYVFDSATNLEKMMLESPLFEFDSQAKCTSLKVLQDQNRITSQQGKIYQIGLMKQPLIQKQNQNIPYVFKFKINKLNANWIAVGVAHKKIVQQTQYYFQLTNTGHGAYMISANGGSWSHSTAELNNKVKAFRFKQGDVICVIVSYQFNTVFFIKQNSIVDFVDRKKEFYELPFIPIEGDVLYPAVAMYYEEDQIEYIPTTNQITLPKYEYLFSETWKHPQIWIKNQRVVKAIGQSGYKPAILDKCLESDVYPSVKQFSFFISKSTADWIAVGMCYKNLVQKDRYNFRFSQTGHGFYMVSSNGGSWSTLQNENNNVVKAIKFKSGDIVTCRVQFNSSDNKQANKIIFKKDTQVFQLSFEVSKTDKLYPCVMLHYQNDEVSVLPVY